MGSNVAQEAFHTFTYLWPIISNGFTSKPNSLNVLYCKVYTHKRTILCSIKMYLVNQTYLHLLRKHTEFLGACYSGTDVQDWIAFSSLISG